MVFKGMTQRRLDSYRSKRFSDSSTSVELIDLRRAYWLTNLRWAARRELLQR